MKKSRRAFFNSIIFVKYFVLQCFVKDYSQISIFLSQTHSSNYHTYLIDSYFQIFTLYRFTFLVFFSKNQCHPLTTLFRIFAKAMHFQKAFCYLKSI